MATRKKVEKVTNDKPTEASVVSKTNSPLVFISHDTRDAELAEEFSNLLNNASAGALKSFRSSDKKGTQGIEYGLDWYPAIMDKIDEASEVVCLLTQRSVERPWILYEAGVAKGKLGKKVIGVAMGIQHSVAFTGPFAQFQNNDGSVEAITKLVVDLVCKVPGLNPPHSHVEKLVQEFHKKAGEIVKKIQTKPEKPEQETNDNIVAKLFEEVKIMFESLPSRIENRIDPDSKRRRRKFHPRMFDEMFHMGMKSGDPNLGFLMMISLLKDDMPWMYEVGMETYRGLKSAKTPTEKKKLISNFERAFEMMGHPMMMEFSGNRSEEMYMFSKEISHYLHRYFERFTIGDKGKE
jgi:TIR domain